MRSLGISDPSGPNDPWAFSVAELSGDYLRVLAVTTATYDQLPTLVAKAVADYRVTNIVIETSDPRTLAPLRDKIAIHCMMTFLRRL